MYDKTRQLQKRVLLQMHNSLSSRRHYPKIKGNKIKEKILIASNLLPHISGSGCLLYNLIKSGGKNTTTTKYRHWRHKTKICICLQCIGSWIRFLRKHSADTRLEVNTTKPTGVKPSWHLSLKFQWSSHLKALSMVWLVDDTPAVGNRGGSRNIFNVGRGHQVNTTLGTSCVYCKPVAIV